MSKHKDPGPESRTDSGKRAGLGFGRHFSGTEHNLRFLARRLRQGELVAVPTETVYGLAANALDPVACRRIFAVKGRPPSDPLIVHVRGFNDLAALAEASPMVRRLAEAFWPGPLTLILRKKKSVPDIVTSGRDSVAVRAPSHRLLRRLLALTGRPLAAPSANPFGYVSPTTAEHVRVGLGKKVRYILDGGPCEIGLESTILDLRNPKKPRLLRPGAITRQQLQKVLGFPVAPQKSASTLGLFVGSDPAALLSEKAAQGQIAPGQLERHYSPHTPIVLHARISPRMIAGLGGSEEAWLFTYRPPTGTGKNTFWLSESKGSRGLTQAAHNLFSTLRSLDEGGWCALHAELAYPAGGLADAINDRLRRAAARPTASVRLKSVRSARPFRP